MRICVVALGKIGLPLAVQCAMKGHDVIGADVNVDVVEDVTAGRVPFPGEANLPEYLAGVVANGRLRATTGTTAAVADVDVVVVVVPLVVGDDGVPDFRAMDAATSAISAGIRPGTLVSYETTLPVGTTRGRFAPALVAGSGLRLGHDLFVCHSPERVFSGRIFEDLRKYPKLIGGLDDPSSKRAAEFYEAVLDFDARPDLARGNGVWDLGSVEAAELAKLAETTYRDVNIGLANTFAMYADSIGVDIFAVIEASNSQPFSHIHQPGIAVGGHCIPVYPRFYLSGDPTASLVAVAHDVNEAMPGYAVAVLTSMLDSIAGSKVAVLGAVVPWWGQGDCVLRRLPAGSAARAGRGRRRCPRPAVHRRRVAITGLRAVPSRRAMRCGSRSDRPHHLQVDRAGRPARGKGDRRRTARAVGGGLRGCGRSSAGTRWSRRLSSPASRPTPSIGSHGAGPRCVSGGSNAGTSCCSSRH